jgi:hypothetical protein
MSALRTFQKACEREYLQSETKEFRRDLSVVFRKHLGAGVRLDEHFAENVQLLSTLLLEVTLPLPTHCRHDRVQQLDVWKQSNLLRSTSHPSRRSK